MVPYPKGPAAAGPASSPQDAQLPEIHLDSSLPPKSGPMLCLLRASIYLCENRGQASLFGCFCGAFKEQCQEWVSHLGLLEASAHYFTKLYTYSFNYLLLYPLIPNFPGGSDGKEAACHAGDLGSTPGLGRSPGAGNGYPLQYSCMENSKDGSLVGYSSWSHRVRHD